MNLPMHPELMVMGDSLAQGCRSLSVTAGLCRQSYGVYICEERRWDFAVPDHPRPVGFDLENIIRHSSVILDAFTTYLVARHIKRNLRENIQAWYDQFEDARPMSARHKCFDNIGVASFEIPDLLDRSYESSLAEFEMILDAGDLEGGIMEVASLVEKTHLPINACFTLNPSQEARYARYTPLRWVEERKPRRLIVQVGHNHGLFGVGFSTIPQIITYRSLPRIEELAERLARLPRDVGEIYYFLLPKVSAVANLIPEGDIEDGYAESYRSAFDPTANEPIDGDLLRNIDRSIHETNDEIRERFREIFERVRPHNSHRLRFLDAYDIFSRYDYKNTRIREKQITIGKHRIDNRRLDGKVRYVGPPGRRRRSGSQLVAGGFQSADGMHPSGVGYAILASEIMQFMGFRHDRKKLLGRALRNEALLKRYPLSLDNIYDIIRIVQKVKKSKSASREKENRISLPALIGMAQKALRL